MHKLRNRLLILALGASLLSLPGCMQAERVAYERHLNAVIAPLPAGNVALGARENELMFAQVADDRP